jgi:hypothetical protein
MTFDDPHTKDNDQGSQKKNKNMEMMMLAHDT